MAGAPRIRHRGGASPHLGGSRTEERPQKPAQWTAFLRKAKVDDCPRKLVDRQTALTKFLGPLHEVLEGDFDALRDPESGWAER